MQKSTWTSLSEMPLSPSDQVAWQVNLPAYAPTNRILVNVQRIGQLARLGGFERLSISSYQGETSRVESHPTSVTPDGTTTTALAVSEVQAEVRPSTIIGNAAKNLDEYNWTRGEVSLNTAEIGRRVGQRDPTYRDPNVWSQELNKELSARIRDAVHDNLIKRPNAATIETYLASITLFVGLDVLTRGVAVRDILPDILANAALYHYVARPIGAWLTGHSPQERRWSVLPVYHLDRAFAVEALSRALPLVKHAEA